MSANAAGMLVCVSHSPIIMIRAKAPVEEPQILALYERCTEQIRQFDPELVLILASDHFAGFHLSLMPPYCVGLAATAVDDVGGFAGPLNVPEHSALQLVKALRDDGFDVATSHKMLVDHGFSQPLHRLLGGMNRVPVIPIFVNAMVPPLLSFARSRGLGESIGRFASESGKRVLIIGSGGLSHHPTRYYPPLGQADPEVHAWQLDAERGGSMSSAAWFERLHQMHIEGAQMLVDGRRTRQDICLNPSFDEHFMAMATALDIDEADTWDAEGTVAIAGIGSMELHAWVAAIQAYKRLDGRPTHGAIYAPALEYGIGYGMVVAGGPGGARDLQPPHPN